MKVSLLGILSCPICYETLRFEGSRSSDRLLDGVLHCGRNHLYQVKNEIPVLKDPKLSEKEFTWKVEFPELQEYDRIREEYDSYLPVGQKDADRRLVDEIAKSVSEEDVIVDIASGMGNLLLKLSEYSWKQRNVMGIDVDEKPLRGAKLKLEKQGSSNNVSLCVMDGKRLGIKSQEVTCVTSFFGFDNIPGTEKALREASRILKARGRLVFAALWLREGSESIAEAEKIGLGEIATEKRLHNVLDKIGFGIDSMEQFYSGKWPHNPMDLLPLENDWFAHVLVTAHKS